MKTILLDEIRDDLALDAYDLKNIPLLYQLLKAYRSTKTAVCIERARYLTEYMKQSEQYNESAALRRAKGINYYLSKRAPLFFDDNLLAGSSTSKPIGAPVYPEFLGLSIWPELDSIGSRKNNPQTLSAQDAQILNLEVFPYWMNRTVMEVTRQKLNPAAMRLMEKFVFFMCGKTTVLSHTTPFYENMLNTGLSGMIQAWKEKEKQCSTSQNCEERKKAEFFQAGQIAMQGILKYTANLAAAARISAASTNHPDRKKHFENLAKVCEQVPAQPPRTFREAINAVWLCHACILGENVNMAMNPGRLDQLLYPWFKKDIEEKRLTLSEALTLCGCLWLKISDNTNLVPETAEKLFGGAGSVPAVTLGGIDKKGSDAVNDLTYIMLKVTELLSIRDPNVNARFHKGVNDAAYRDRVTQVITRTGAIPAIYNDIANIATLINQGVAPEHARDYTIIGCVELASAGREYSSSSSILLSLPAALEMTLFNGKRPSITQDEQIGPLSGDPLTFVSFKQFFDAFSVQTRWLIDQAVSLNEALGSIHQTIAPSPLLSCFFEGPLEKGLDLIDGGALYNSSGATHIGFADTVDSLNAIQGAVFITKRMTMKEMIEAVNTDFAPPHDVHRSYLINKVPKYGTENPLAIENSKNLITLLFDHYQSKTNYRGGKYRPAFWTMTNHAGLGKLCCALPSGRRAKTVYSSGITPVSQRTQELFAALSAVAGLNSLHIPGGVALNIKCTPPVSLNGENQEYIQKFGAMIDAYFQLGGMQVQFNLQSYETLLDAKKHPENHPNLIVRVSGYSAFFKDLNEAMQNELITRTQYNLISGKAIALPDDTAGDTL
jgi:formate C-acetyltransferase